MYLNRRVAVAALVAFVGALAGCQSSEVAKEPSLLWAGSGAEGSITSGTDIAGNAVQGQAYIGWDQRLAERVEVAAGDTVVLDTSTAAAGACIADVTTLDVGFGFAMDVDPGACLEDGAIMVQPTVSTDYTVQALAGEGRCEQSEFGVYTYPEECDFLTVTIDVFPPADVNLSASAADPTVKTTTVAADSDVTLYYSVDLASVDGGYHMGIYDAANDTLDPCVYTDDYDGSQACYYTEDTNADGDFTGSGTVVVPGVTADTVVSIDGDNGADDGLGTVPAGEEVVTITIG